jgi:bifunctional N-acetylglucosamine-1-phosphate-uridyltransferase/glucosamine-1-phosphate-acetyltransferase GlmU-like protein
MWEQAPQSPKDVPDEALAVGRGKQVIKEDWAKNKK